MLNRQVLIAATVLGLLLGAGGAVHAQEISVTPVYTAPAYAQPLKVDTDRYAAQQRERARSNRSARDVDRSGRLEPSQQELQALMRQLTPEYNRRLQRDGEASANAWIRQAAFEKGQQAARARGANR